MARALWKGAISFGLIHIPVELFPAEQRDELDLTLLDRRDFAPVGYRRVNKRTEKEVPREQIVKGYEYEEDQYVVLTEDELKSANVKATQTVDLIAFVPAADIGPVYFEQPYYLAPTRGGTKVYALLRETLRRADKVGIGQVVIRTRQHLAALMPVGDVLLLNTLRYRHELRDSGQLPLPDADLKAAGVAEREVKMALSLVESMSEAWRPEQYHDTYRDDVLALIDRKVRSKQTHAIAAPAQTDDDTAPAADNVVDLMALLKQSIAGRDAPRPAKPAPRRKSPQARAGAERQQRKRA
ncbi:non-homologous end joining protein Ku [Chitiniphilus eburneus]|uniref:Non-homologous end joining protein Ku n=1 Tax=Chitiniphilus eburneus TaxID=2571148 RepID=A0A4V5MQT2_9NEIS|nr:Ku protein [Chitiniphilus eburneus]TJZ73798.1 Ku protein [Chitiniphilus eburneus]